jgi:hypothetical protein
VLTRTSPSLKGPPISNNQQPARWAAARRLRSAQPPKNFCRRECAAQIANAAAASPPDRAETQKRPACIVATIVDPKADAPGSTSVACWLVGLLNGSELICVNGTVARANEGIRIATVATANAATPLRQRAGAIVWLAILESLGAMPTYRCEVSVTSLG